MKSILHRMKTFISKLAYVFGGCLILLSTGTMAQNIPGTKGISLVIHGGAGTILRKNMTPEKEDAYQKKLEEALNAGYTILEDGGTSEEAIVAAIVIMEDSPLFNAGKGAVFTNAETNELDASIMNGRTGLAGAVAGVTTVKNPILAAKKVKDNSLHVMMTGKGADLFAVEQGLEIVDPSYFFTHNRFNQVKRIKEKIKGEGRIPEHLRDYKFGTVGAVALDKYGNIAAGTSTGGMTNKRYGRVGDAPIIGAGTYADNKTCGVSGTGHGEFFMRNVVAYDIAALMKYKKMKLKDAAKEVILTKLRKIEGSGGVIAMDAKGNISMTFNTPGMYRGYINSKGQPKTFIYEAE